MRKKFKCFISLTCTVVMPATSGLKATDGTEVDYGREWSPYVTVRGGLLFGESKFSFDAEKVPFSSTVRNKNSGFGSGEFGFLFYDERVSVGLELGYLSVGMKVKEEIFSAPKAVPGEAYAFTGFSVKDAEINRFFVACNIALRKRLGEKAFLYGGIGAGMSYGNFHIAGCVQADDDNETWNLNGCKSDWRLLGQAFAGFGVCLNESWQLMAGYRLRWMPCRFDHYETADDLKCFYSGKQNFIHAAEVGLTYRF